MANLNKIEKILKNAGFEYILSQGEGFFSADHPQLKRIIIEDGKKINFFTSPIADGNPYFSRVLEENESLEAVLEEEVLSDISKLKDLYQDQVDREWIAANQRHEAWKKEEEEKEKEAEKKACEKEKAKENFLGSINMLYKKGENGHAIFVESDEGEELFFHFDYKDFVVSGPDAVVTLDSLEELRSFRRQVRERLL